MIFLIGSGSRRTSVGTAKNLVAGRKLGSLQKIDHLDRIAAIEILFADTRQIVNGSDRLVGLSCDVKTQLPMLGIGGWSGSPLRLVHLRPLSLGDLYPLRAYAKLADIRRMRHAPRLNDKELTFEIPLSLDALDCNPAIHQRGDV